MEFDYIKGQTHGPEYSWHKYWSRKPANVIRTYLKGLVPKNGLVVDPFSGSGVVLRESTRLGLNCQSYDVNPIAVEISRFMISTVDKATFIATASSIIDDVEERLGYLYEADQKVIRFLVHNATTICKSCKQENVYDKKIHGVNGKKCTYCSAKVSFGLANLNRTVISEVIYSDGSSNSEAISLDQQETLSALSELNEFVFDMPLVDNRRTLTSRETGTKNYFTNRNFWILSEVALLAHEIADSNMRSALLLMITGSSAQCSRLIASRGKLSGGGQAWTIPGFWIPPVHLESNPFTHLRSRLKKMDNALSALQKEARGSGRIDQKSAEAGLTELKLSNTKAELIFLDPPYGDSVAFVEFSALWNSFLKTPFEYSEDISVSDRQQSPMSMTDYEESLKRIMVLAHDVLADSGKILLTFNNQDLNAWRAIVHSLQVAGFKPIHSHYQDPAVVSSKAQKSLQGSYVGDFYVVFNKSTKRASSINDHKAELIALLENAAAVRGNMLHRSLATRFAIQYWLNFNIDATDILQLNNIFAEIFEHKDSFFTPKVPHSAKRQIPEIIAGISRDYNLDSQSGINEFVKATNDSLHWAGCPSAEELLQIARQFQDHPQLW
jgi:hypothetical protein